MQEHDTSARPQPRPGLRQLVAVIYAFETYRDGERQLMLQEELPASALGMVQPQLESAPKRALVDYGPGILVYSDYRAARAAAQGLTTVAAYVALREVVAGFEAGSADVWTVASGARYSAVVGGLSETVKA